MELPIKFDTVKSGRPLYILSGYRLKFPKNVFIAQKIDFVLANSADPGEMPQYDEFLKSCKMLVLN